MSARTKRTVRTYRCDKMQGGDIFFSRSRSVKAGVIVYASTWGNSREGRRRARAAVRDESVPNHAGNIHDRYGQKYIIEAGPFGYEEGNLDDYRVKRCTIIRMFRWKGFEEDEGLRAHAAKVLELWSRRSKNKKYDWWGAITSSTLGRALFPHREEDPNRLYCSEGVLTLIVICGFLGKVLPYDTELLAAKNLIQEHADEMPASANPVDLLAWMEKHPRFTEIQDFLA